MQAILAISNNNVIGVANKLPWHIKEDLQHFKRYTDGKTLVAGTNTIKSLPFKLPNRKLVQFGNSKKHEFADDIVSSNEALFIKYPGAIIIGGSQTITSMLDAITYFVITHIDLNIKSKDSIVFDIGFLSKGWVVVKEYRISENAIVREYCRGK